MRDSDDFDGRVLFNKYPWQEYPALAAMNKNIFAVLVASMEMEIFDRKKKKIIETGEARAMIKKYDLGFWEDRVDVDGIMDVYEKIKNEL